METEVAYFNRRAAEERRCGSAGEGGAKAAHLALADKLEGLARTIEAEQRRQLFYDVKADFNGPRSPNPDGTKGHGLWL